MIRFGIPTLNRARGLAGITLAALVALAPAQAEDLAEGPPPPAASRRTPAQKAAPADPGPVRIHWLGGFELGPDFWEEGFASLPLGGEDALLRTRRQWADLESRFGFHPEKHLSSITWLAFGPQNGTTRMALVIKGRFDLARLWPIMAADPTLAEKGSTFSIEDGIRTVGNRMGGKAWFLDDTTIAAVPPTSEAKLEDLKKLEPSPLDVEAMRAFYGLGGTRAYANLLVSPAQRETMGRTPGPLALIGPQLETLGVRVEGARIQVGATFLREDTVAQVQGLLGMALQMARAAAEAALQPPDPNQPQPGFGALLSPSTAMSSALISEARGWLWGIEPVAAGNAFILNLDRTKIPWLRASRLVPLMPVLAGAIPTLLQFAGAAQARGAGAFPPGMIPGGPGFGGMSGSIPDGSQVEQVFPEPGPAPAPAPGPAPGGAPPQETFSGPEPGIPVPGR